MDLKNYEAQKKQKDRVQTRDSFESQEISSYNPTCACCGNSSNKDILGCKTVESSWCSDSNNLMGKCVADSPKGLSITGAKCDGLFMPDKCQFYENNGSNMIGELSYSPKKCDPWREPVLSPGEISGIVIGIVSLIAAVVSIWYSRRQLKIALRESRGQQQSAETGIELGERISRTGTEERINDNNETAQQQRENQIEQPPKNS